MQTIINKTIDLDDIRQALKCAYRAGKREELAREWKERENFGHAACLDEQRKDWVNRSNEWIEKAGLPAIDFKGE